MNIDKIFQDQLIKVTQEAAISVYPHLGKNNKIIADEAATNSMRNNLNKMNIKGNIVIGEGEMDEAPMLYIGEKVGTNKGNLSILHTVVNSYLLLLINSYFN